METKNSLFKRLGELLLPRRCAMCGVRLSTTERVVCASCDITLPRTNFCYNLSDNEMARLFWAQINVERCAAMFFYRPRTEISKMIIDMKYYGKRAIARDMGRMAAAELQETGMFDDIDFIVPVPLYKTRAGQRGYNQSEEIARGVAEITGLEIRNDVVKRSRYTPSQTTLKPSERRSNVEGSFSITKPEVAKGRHILIIDDIVTTGSTVCACGKEIEKAGDVTISVLSLGFTKN